MIPSTSVLVMVAAPWQLIVVAILVLGLFAPHLLPKIGRIVGRMLRAEVFRRIGLGRLQAVGQSRAAQPKPVAARAVEILMPDRPEPTLRVEAEQSLAPERSRTRLAPMWLVTCAFAVATAAILWFLLHSR